MTNGQNSVVLAVPGATGHESKKALASLAVASSTSDFGTRDQLPESNQKNFLCGTKRLFN